MGKTPGERGEGSAADELIERGFEGADVYLHKPIRRTIKYCTKIGLSRKQVYRIIERIIDEAW